ncbi:MAG: VCBS repeat-containing protein [Pyrinomonadaceae bacterium]
MNSTQFNAYLLLYQGSYPAGTLTAQDDNGGGGTNARIPATSGFLTLPATGAYTILANSLAAGETGGYSLTLGTNSGGTIPITVQTNPAGRSFTVDGTTYTSAQNFNWTSGTSHTIATTSPQNIAPGARYSWENWNGGGGAISQTVSPTSATTYTANFALTYQLTTNSNPSNGGITTPVSGNWYSSPQNVQISAVPNSGYTFSGWTGSGNGSYSGTNNPASITINGPITETANFTQIPPGRKPFDYDGDGRSDLSVRRQTDNTWYLLRGTAGYMSMTFGVDGDLMVPADYDGDAKTDVAMFRPSTGQWFIFNIGSQTFQTYSWGASSDLPIPADHDGDGKAELVVFRPSTNTWYTRFSNGTFASTVFGVAGDKPVVGDFDGDGKADIGLYRPSDHNWYILKTGFGFFVQTWGVNGDIPVPADYDGDGKTDVAVFRPSTGQWFRIRSTAGFDTVNWGANGDKPIPADYDGDGKADVAVFRPSNATWYIVGSTSGQLIQNYGVAGDLPTQGAFIY